MKKTYSNILQKMVDMDIDRQYLASFLGKSVPYVNTRFSGSGSWSLDEMYKMAVLFKIPVECLIDYFPPRPALRKEMNLDEKLIFITPPKRVESVKDSGVSWQYGA